MKPRRVGTPITTGLLSPAGFDRLFRRYGVRSLIDFPYPCRTVPTQVLRVRGAFQLWPATSQPSRQCRTTTELSSDGVPPKTVAIGY